MSPEWPVSDDSGLMIVEERSDADVYARYAGELVRFRDWVGGPSDAPDVVSEAVIRPIFAPVRGRAGNQRALLYRGRPWSAAS